MINKTNNETLNEGRTSWPDAGSTGDYSTLPAKTSSGKDITLRLYGR